MNYWGCDMEGRDGLNWALQTGCSTSSIHIHMQNTHIQTHTHTNTHTIAGRLVRGCVNAVTQTNRQTGKETGPHRSLPRFPTSKTHQAQKNKRPRDQTDMFLFFLRPTPRVSPPFPIHVSPKKQGGFQGQEITMPPSFPNCKGLHSSVCESVYFGCVGSFEPQTFPLCSDLSGWKQSSGWALFLRLCSLLCGPVTQGLCLPGGSIVNLLLDTLSCRSVQLDNRPLAVFCSAPLFVVTCNG